MRGTWKRGVRWALLAVHAVLVLPAVGLWLAAASSATSDSPDANIGAGLVGLYLLVWGAPWSMTAWLFDLNSLNDAARDLFVAGLPLLNLAIHAGLAWRSHRRLDNRGGQRPSVAGDQI